jgi:hypothetical protein
MCDHAKPIDEESVDRGDRGEDRPAQRSLGRVVSFPVSRIAERNRSFLAHPSNAARGRRPLLGRGEQASVPQAGHQARAGGTDAMLDWLEQDVVNGRDDRRGND